MIYYNLNFRSDILHTQRKLAIPNRTIPQLGKVSNLNACTRQAFIFDIISRIYCYDDIEHYQSLIFMQVLDYKLVTTSTVAIIYGSC